MGDVGRPTSPAGCGGDRKVSGDGVEEVGGNDCCCGGSGGGHGALRSVFWPCPARVVDRKAAIGLDELLGRWERVCAFNVSAYTRSLLNFAAWRQSMHSPTLCARRTLSVQTWEK